MRPRIVTRTVDVSALGAEERVNIPFSETAEWSLQINFTSITGTTDGVLQLQQSNDGTNWNDMALTPSSYTISAANGTTAFEKATFTGKYLAIKITKNNMTGGTLEFILNIKPKAI